jgi:hypothetical protein
MMQSAASTSSRPASNPDQAQPLSSDSTTATAPVPSAVPSGISSQAALAISSDRVNGYSRNTTAGSMMHSVANTSSRPASTPDQAQPLPSDSTTASVPVPPAAHSGISSQAAFAISSDRVNVYGRTATAGSTMHSVANTSSRPASTPDQAQPLPSDSTTTTVPVPPADQVAAQAKDSLDGQDSARTSDGSSKPAAEAPDFGVAANSPDPSPQIAAAQPNADASDAAAVALQAPSVAASQKKVIDAVLQADAPTVPVASGASTASTVATPVGPSVAAQPVAENLNLQMIPPTTSMLPTKADSIQSIGKAPPKNVADATSPKNPDLSNAIDAAKAKATSTASDGSSHSAQSNSQSNAQSSNQPAQHSQADASQPAAAMPKVVDSSAAQPQPIPTPALAHEAPTAIETGGLPATSGPDHTGAPSNPLDGDEITAATGINASRIVQSMSESEMRVGLHSSEFGAISIRTSVSPQQMLAQISLDHPGLSQAISAHVASVQTKLGNDSGLNTLIQVNHQAASTNGQGGSQQREQRSSAALSVPVESAGAPADPDVGVSAAVVAGASSGYRLDIRA